MSLASAHVDPCSLSSVRLSVSNGDLWPGCLSLCYRENWSPLTVSPWLPRPAGHTAHWAGIRPPVISDTHNPLMLNLSFLASTLTINTVHIFIYSFFHCRHCGLCGESKTKKSREPRHCYEIFSSWLVRLEGFKCLNRCHCPGCLAWGI